MRNKSTIPLARVVVTRILPDIAAIIGGSAWDMADRGASVLMVRLGSTRYPSDTLLERLARHRQPAVRQYLAQYPARPGHCRYQEVLASDPDRRVRSSLARCEGYVCGSALTELALDPEVSVRAALAHRKDLPLVAWGILARDPSETVRLRAAKNSDGAPSALRLLCSDPVATVRSAVQANPATPLDGRVEVVLRR